MGNTYTDVETLSFFSVHPHTHGEHEEKVTSRNRWIGSSPHAWGTHFPCCSHLSCDRFIPTRMGNTFCCFSCSLLSSVHPHTHGEHVLCPDCRFPELGSSPHAWGTRNRNVAQRLGRRFIPTRMGNTHSQNSPGSRRSVHPHTHGEHDSYPMISYTSGGSSPHAWGTLRLVAIHPFLSRFIPTRMGNTV